MLLNSKFWGCGGIGGVVVLSVCMAVAGDNPTSQADAAASGETSTSPESVTAEEAADHEAVEVPRVSLEVARDRARLMHDLYSATLDAMHHRYFHGDLATVPARAMEDVFKDIERQHHSKSRWISASFSPMSIDHKPKTEFEKQAASKIAKGEDVVETIEEGYYRRAGSISLNRGCISCHSGVFASTSSAKKFAGLIISIPVEKRAQLTKSGSQTID